MLPIEEPETRFETYAAKFWDLRYGKLGRNCRGAIFLIPCLRVQHVFENPLPATHLNFFPENMGAVSDGTVKRSIRKYLEWKEDREANGNQMFWLFTAGRCSGDTERRLQETKNDKINF